ncbi:MAG: cysteine desulfurase [Clostridia bacterium]|nr:cysteine desulfurase [Clostridia bacterium]
MMSIYFDNSATTELSVKAKEKMAEAFEVYGNPSSVHSVGDRAAEMLSRCRGDVARALGVSGGKLIFTSGGSEANNFALKGVAFSKKRYRGGKIIISAAEHPSVLKTASFLESEGFRVVRIDARGGVFDLDTFEKELTGDVFLVSVMLVNNELGYINDVNRIYDIAKRTTGAVVHTDAVQGFSKVKGVKADLVSVSGHKIGGPKGVGALFIKDEIIKSRGITPLINGGEQEYDLRAGTENLIGIAGFAGAAEYRFENECKIAENTEKIGGIIKDGLRNVPEIRIHTPESGAVPSIINLSVGSIRAETLTNYLSSVGIMISAGSACSSKSRELSPALLSFGLSEAEARTAVRISIGENNTEDDARELVSALRSALNSLRGAVWQKR